MGCHHFGDHLLRGRARIRAVRRGALRRRSACASAARFVVGRLEGWGSLDQLVDVRARLLAFWAKNLVAFTDSQFAKDVLSDHRAKVRMDLCEVAIERVPLD